MVVAAAALRVLPHPPNFTPVAAIALFGGAQFDRKLWAFGVPLLAMLLSDVVSRYAAALPFHGSSLVSCVAFSAVLFGGAALAERRFPALAARA